MLRGFAISPFALPTRCRTGLRALASGMGRVGGLGVGAPTAAGVFLEQDGGLQGHHCTIPPPRRTEAADPKRDPISHHSHAGSAEKGSQSAALCGATVLKQRRDFIICTSPFLRWLLVSPNNSSLERADGTQTTQCSQLGACRGSSPRARQGRQSTHGSQGLP